MGSHVMTLAFLLGTVAAYGKGKGVIGTPRGPDTTGAAGPPGCWPFEYVGIQISCASVPLVTTTLPSSTSVIDQKPPSMTGGGYGKVRALDRRYGDQNKQGPSDQNYTALSPAPSSGLGHHICDRIEPAYLNDKGIPVDFKIFPCYSVGTLNATAGKTPVKITDTPITSTANGVYGPATPNAQPLQKVKVPDDSYASVNRTTIAPTSSVATGPAAGSIVTGAACVGYLCNPEEKEEPEEPKEPEMPEEPEKREEPEEVVAMRLGPVRRSTRRGVTVFKRGTRL